MGHRLPKAFIRRVAAFAAIAMAAVPLVGVAPAGARIAPSTSVSPGVDVIVRYADGTDVAAEAAALVAQGATVTRRYSAVFPGLAATVSAQASDALARNPRVAWVETDQAVTVSSTQVSPPWGPRPH